MAYAVALPFGQTVSMEVDMRAGRGASLFEASMPLEVIGRDILFGEGPAWDRRRRRLLFTDICGDNIQTWDAQEGQRIAHAPSGRANGMCMDREGRLVIAGWGNRTVWRLEADGTRTTLASHWQGMKLNSPNDICMRSDGSIFFTDPQGGLVNVGMVGDDLQKYLDFQGVFRIAPDGVVHLVTDEFVYPNGICLSPDESLLYVNDTREKLIRVYDLDAGGRVGPARLFHRQTHPDPGIPDGMKCDAEGNLYTTGPGGIWVHAPDGAVLARLKVPGHPGNFCFGDDDNRTLYVVMLGWLTRTRVAIPGAVRW
ncbi:MAG: SMP-30/gluconolactonase/LRE family protein [Burkholderiales bacterium]